MARGCEFIRVGSRRTAIYRRGHGAPTVVVEAGGGHFSFDWREIVDQVAAFTTCVAYDRAGLGASDASERPRTPTNIARELRDVLVAADVPQPYVLVGHSLAGIWVRRFAELFEDRVAGMVLVDPSHPDQWRRLPAGRSIYKAALISSPRPARNDWRADIAKQRPMLSPALLDMRTRLQFRHTSVATARSEFVAAFNPRNRVGTRPLPAVPLVVLSRGRAERRPGLPEDDVDRFHQTWRRLHEEIASLVPEGRVITARRSGHRIMWEQPSLVASTVKRLVRDVRAAGEYARQKGGHPLARVTRSPLVATLSPRGHR